MGRLTMEVMWWSFGDYDDYDDVNGFGDYDDVIANGLYVCAYK